MGLFDGVLGGIIGGEMATVVNGLIERHGGVEGVVNQLRSNGFGPTVNSWMSEGPNAPIAPQEVHAAFGEQTMNELAAKAGISPEVLAQKLSEILPHAVSALKPEGSVPNS